MDKNMISIDDLVKQRLFDREEEERAGAWSNMSALLDKEMPLRKPIGLFNWRRAVTVATGLVLVAAVGMGGYQLTTSYKTNSNTELAVTTTSTPPATDNTNGSSNNTNNNTPAELVATTPSETEKTEAVDNKTNDNTKTDAVVEAKKTDDHKAVQKSISATTKATDNIANNNRAKPDVAKTEPVTKVVAKTSTSTVSNNKNTEQKSGKSLNASENKIVTETVAINNKANNSQPAKTDANSSKELADLKNDNKLNNNNKQQSTESIATNNKSGKTESKTPANIYASGGATKTENKTTTTNENGLIKQQEKPAKADNNVAKESKTDKASNENKAVKQFKDSINMIATREKYSVKEGWVKDTVQKNRVARFDVVPVDPANAVAINQIIPGASLDDQVKLVSLEKSKVSSRKISNYDIASSKFEEMVKATKFNLSKITFHSGIIGGVNTSLATTPTAGIQLGMFGTANISEHVSVFTEIKYFQRWGGSNVVVDNYNKNIKSDPAPNNPGQVIHTWDSIDHSFKYPTLNSIRIPIAVRYAVKRFNMFCGAEFGYNFAVNAEEIELQGIKVTQETKVNAEGLRYDVTKNKPGITYKDFASRMEIGGMVGAAYSLTPATSIDLRVIQSMWNNAKSVGETRVFSELYSNPSIQFNVSYRFSNNKFRAYRR